jgi:hypothetical protein
MGWVLILHGKALLKLVVALAANETLCRFLIMVLRIEAPAQKERIHQICKWPRISFGNRQAGLKECELQRNLGRIYFWKEAEKQTLGTDKWTAILTGSTPFGEI